jgi:hypothetical protein
MDRHIGPRRGKLKRHPIGRKCAPAIGHGLVPQQPADDLHRIGQRGERAISRAKSRDPISGS